MYRVISLGIFFSAEGIMKIWVFKKRAILILAVVLVSALVVGIISVPSVTASTSTRSLPIYCVDSDTKKVALTFDAAWGNEDTEELISILAKYNVKATFFVVGEWVDKYPESVKALHDAGHDVMSHSNHHDHMPTLSVDKIIADLTAVNEKISNVTGITPNLFRAPYGDYDNKVIDTVSSIGMYTIQWDVDSLDWKNLSASEIAQRVLGKVQNGSIVLFHNAALNTPAALSTIIEGLLNQGFEIVKVNDLIYKENYYIDHTGRQFKNNG